MLDLVNLITLVGAVQGVFFGLVLLGLPGGNRLANRFLALFLLFFSLTMLGIVAYSTHWILKAPHWGLVHTPLGAILGGAFLLYILAMTRKNFRPNGWHHVLLWLPALIILVWLAPFYALSAAEKRTLLEASYTSLPDTWRYIFIFSNVVNFACLLSSAVLVLRHERVIREVYSSPLNKSLTWTRHFLYTGFAIFMACVICSFYDLNWADSVSNCLMSVVIYVFGYRAMRQPEIFSDVSAEAIPEDSNLSLVHSPAGKYGKSGLSKSKAQALQDKLDELMNTQKIYLDPTLNLQQLSDRLGITPHQVSQLLNQFCGESFSDFINRYRVDYFKNAVTNPANAHLSLLAVAFESGFNSKAAFNAVFKKVTGQTPSEFARQANLD